MKHSRALFLALISATAFALTGCSSEPESYKDRIELSAAPAQVQAAVKQAVGTGKLEHLVMESEDGKVFYEAKIEGEGDHDRTLKFTATGQLVEEETEIELKDAPAAVREAIQAKYPNAEIEELEHVQETPGGVYFEAEIKTADMKRELKLDPAGKILEDECKCEDEKKDKEDKDDKK